MVGNKLFRRYADVYVHLLQDSTGLGACRVLRVNLGMVIIMQIKRMLLRRVFAPCVRRVFSMRFHNDSNLKCLKP